MNYDAHSLSKTYYTHRVAHKQRQGFIPKFASLLKWNIGEDAVMDVGCGPGDATHKDLLPAIPEVKTVIAIDVLPAMIDFAKLHNFHPKIEYHVADITKRETLEKWIGGISHIFSTFCLQWLKDQEGAFRNMFSLLKENGEAAVFFLLSAPLHNCYDDIINSPKWKKFVEGAYNDVPESHKKGYGSDHYKDILERIGFEVLVCEDTYTDVVFNNDDDAKEILASYCSLTSSIPEELKEEFKNDFFEIYIKHNGRDANNRTAGKNHTLAFHLRKPVKYSTFSTMDYDAHSLSKAYDLNKSSYKVRQDFLRKFTALMKWNNGEDVVMDVGCGTGDATHKDLLHAIPEVKTVIAMDVLPAMIDFAKIHNFHPKIEYHVADITKRATLEKWIGKISHIFSMYCLQWLKDQEGAFRNMFGLLKENGEAAVLFLISSPLNNCHDDIINSPKWKKFVEGAYNDASESHKKGYGSDHYKDILERVGFEVLFCEDTYVDLVFDDDEIAKECLASFCSFTSSIPEELKEEFKNDFFEIYIKRNGRDVNNRTAGKNHTLAFHLRKPVKYST